jgi:hypothetical protein
MTGPQTHRVSAYNTSKFSENKIHDDTVARKYGFSGGLVPGVDVLAYMLHMPVAKWGRAFLERGLIEARFVKPVYDGETAEVSAAAEADGLTIEVQSKGELCATGSASLPASAPSFSLGDYTAVTPVKERRPANVGSYEIGKWLGTEPRRWAGEAANEYLADIRETDAIYGRDGLGHPGLYPRIMNKVLVDNAILGPWIHVGTRMQLLAAAKVGDGIDSTGEGGRQLRQEGPPLRRARRTGRRQRHHGARPLLAHRDLSTARAGGGLGPTSSTRHGRA